MIENRQKIIISSYDDVKHPVYAGGGAYAVREIAKYLSRSYEIEVITGNYPGAENSNFDGVRYTRIGPSFLGARFNQLLFHFILPYYVKTKIFDLWIESFTPPFSTSLTPLFTSKPVVGLVHMLSAKDMVRKYYLPFNIVEAIGLKHYKYFIALTESILKQIRKYNTAANIQIIGNGVHAPKTLDNNVDSPEKKYLTFIGRIEINQKGIDLLLQSYSKLIKKKNIKLVIAGSGPKCQLKTLNKLISLHKLTDKVILTGRIGNEQKDKLFRQTLVGIIPSRFETLSITALEMMSYGIPLVTFDIPGFAWAPSGSIVRVEQFDTDKLSNAILQLLQAKTIRENLSKHAVKYANLQNWESVGFKYEEFISEILRINEASNKNRKSANNIDA